jgi:hypothetical protein
MLIGTGNETRADRARTQSTEERAGAFTRLYEARAYVVYNLALRIACERDVALTAAESAFLRQAEAGASEDSLVAAVVAAATSQAGRKPKPSGVGESEQDLLRASAALPAPERAALALTIMADMPVAETAATLHVGEDTAAELVQRATNGFAAETGVEPGAVYDLYVEWGWADPPKELWERVYPAFRRAVERSSEGVASAPLPAPAATVRKIGRRFVRLAGVVLVVAGAVAVAATQGSGGSKAPGTGLPTTSLDAAPPSVADPGTTAPALPEASGTGKTADPVAALQAKAHKPLTPKELDQLRLKELAALRNYQRRQTDQRLTKTQRDYAAKKIDDFRALAREREKVRQDAKQLASRERALQRAQQRLEAQRRKDAAARAKQHPAKHSPSDSESSPQQSTPPPNPRQSGSGQSSSPQGGTSGDGAPTSNQAQEQCVQDTQSGAYICPDG